MKKTIGFFLLLSIASCATRPGSVTPVEVSETEFSNLSCQEATTLLSAKIIEEDTLSQQQLKTANRDALGVSLIFLPIGSIFGRDVEGELAQAKGEVAALEKTVELNCDSHDL